MALDPIEQVLAEREIRRAMLDYCRGVDRCDADLIASTYHDDSVDDHGVFVGTGRELADLVATTLLQKYESTMHTVGDSLIDFTDDHTAYVETYVFADHRAVDDDGARLERFGARYLDRFEDRGAGWKIADRVVAVEWSDTQPIQPGRDGPYARGLRSPQDLAYQRTPRDPQRPLPRMDGSER